MKNLIVLFAMALSFSSFALDISRGTTAITLLPTVLTSMSNGGRGWKEAKIIEGVNEYHQSGKLSGELEALVNEIKEIYEVSDAEAVDMAMDMIGV
ncbi:hypothetical protein SHI21_18505 [Bacteriovorax sp. PP10]|uniref:Uncharacterized protein n=1 Tax=Bacteriovorax antarcticus TaxID=3088717 RepID=A0ABU5VYU2_9BACT|nr:hypothetical protein [Bacteriovorax sp. PP10]MEA9358233.1 hypothetical protein [Bacteriovorax sp. PP10]